MNDPPAILSCCAPAAATRTFAIGIALADAEAETLVLALVLPCASADCDCDLPDPDFASFDRTSLRVCLMEKTKKITASTVGANRFSVTTMCVIPAALALIIEKMSAISGGEDGTIRIWDLHKRACAAVLNNHVSVVRGLDFADERTLLSASRDKVVCVWDIPSRKTKRIIPVFEVRIKLESC
ncbi:hypothetical protein AMAG_18249 [Allomyces macrogynus ATCC 38327]|uniref:Uncharacterized protein n=1 Tax=Allomyces macrogynus (strain ATCC 38327) TaxID=578462 RepID=A0A0L0S7W5_ALLM3|nr:hypothetical protein AMAG_18249 [Allomyces macrogynus ATCC 38327]|eukprot:KNE58449.1 hypothetical protein AMAG_18249 [Allomyces macrogynus ATCC 38327]